MLPTCGAYGIHYMIYVTLITLPCVLRILDLFKKTITVRLAPPAHRVSAGRRGPARRPARPRVASVVLVGRGRPPHLSRVAAVARRGTARERIPVRYAKAKTHAANDANANARRGLRTRKTRQSVLRSKACHPPTWEPRQPRNKHPDPPQRPSHKQAPTIMASSIP
jgi:hypothetical protein